MGYNTTYSVEVQSRRAAKIPPEIAEDLIYDLRHMSEGAAYAISATGDVEEETKWYEHEADLRAFSKNHPDFLFVLSGTGEGCHGAEPDIWKKYFLGGKMQEARAKMSIEPFDPAQLK